MSTNRPVDFKKTLIDLKNAILSGNEASIEKNKISCLFEVSDLFELVINYITLESSGVHFDFGSSVIAKGTKLYRIRKYDSLTDYSNEKEWTPPPFKNQNRANRKGQTALYLSTSEPLCVLETHIKYGERYVLGTYECMEDLRVGGYLYAKNNDSFMTFAGIVINAVLIAPSRNENNKELFNLLDGHFGEVLPSNIQVQDVSWERNMLLPFKFAVMNKRNQYYDITNQLCDILMQRYPMGIRYSSCYLPIETISISSNQHNLVLYEDGISKIKFMEHTIKRNNRKGFTSTNIAKTLLNNGEKHNDKI